MSERYQIVAADANLSSKELAKFLAKDGQLLLPMLDLIEQAQVAIDDLLDVMGRATIEAILRMSAEQLAGPRQQGKKNDRDVCYHGTQRGRVALKERQLRVDKPRLRRKRPERGQAGEVEIPAYAAMQKDGRLANRMLEIMMAGVSTRRYETVLPEMAEQVGISKSQVSREFIDAGERLPKEQHDQARCTLKAAWKLDANEGTAKIEQYASWLEREWPSAAASLREGLAELFTINRLGLPSSLRRCLGTTNLIDNSHSALRGRTNRVKNRQSGTMAVRWAAAALEAASKGFRRIMGYEQLWILKAALDESRTDDKLAQETKAG